MEKRKVIKKKNGVVISKCGKNFDSEKVVDKKEKLDRKDNEKKTVKDSVNANTDENKNVEVFD